MSLYGFARYGLKPNSLCFLNIFHALKSENGSEAGILKNPQNSNQAIFDFDKKNTKKEINNEKIIL